MTRTVVVAAIVAACGLAPIVATSGQACRIDNGPTVTCAPLVAPSGAWLVGYVEEDGSARYADGSVLDAEDGFRP